MESCEGMSNSAFCDFTSMVLARKEDLKIKGFKDLRIQGFIMVLGRKEETEGEEWFEHWRRMNAKMEWQFDPM